MTSYRKFAEDLGGQKTWSFNQGKLAQVFKRIESGTVAGICWACTVAYIIGEHKSDPLKAKLGSNGDLTDAVYNKLCKLQSSVKKLNQSLNAQEAAYINAGLGFNKTESRSATSAVGPLVSGFVDRACTWDDNYVHVRVEWKLASHAFALKMKANDYRLFDCNSGEYFFKQKKDLKQFMHAYVRGKYSRIRYYEMYKVG